MKILKIIKDIFSTDPDEKAIISHEDKTVTCQCWHCKHVYRAAPGTDCPKCGAA